MWIAFLAFIILVNSQLQFGSYYPYQDARFIFYMPFNNGASSSLNFLLQLRETNCEPLFSYDEFPLANVELTGACIDYFSCLLKGKIVGFCQFGTKACCLVITTEGTVSTPVSYFINTDPPTDTRLVIRRPSGFYCQVKLTFGPFELLGPDSEGFCVFESMTVTGHDGEDIIICGINTYQHMYLNFQDRTNIVLKMVANEETSNWIINIEQILCLDTERLAPGGCLQYYKGSVVPSVLSSFNYQVSPDSNDTATQQIANLDYTICFDDSYNGLVLVPPALINVSNAIGAASTYYEGISITGNETFSLIDVPEFDSNCSGTDYLRIMGSSYGYYECDGPTSSPELSELKLVNGTADTFCGPTLPFFIYTTSKRIRVVTNSVEEDDGDYNNLGFIIPYRRTNESSLQEITKLLLNEFSPILDNSLNWGSGRPVKVFCVRN